jgi:hypothetical protein
MIFQVTQARDADIRVLQHAPRDPERHARHERHRAARHERHRRARRATDAATLVASAAVSPQSRISPQTSAAPNDPVTPVMTRRQVRRALREASATPVAVGFADADQPAPGCADQ